MGQSRFKILAKTGMTETGCIRLDHAWYWTDNRVSVLLTRESTLLNWRLINSLDANCITTLR